MQYLITQLEAEENHFFPAKRAILSRGWEPSHFTPVEPAFKSDQPCRILYALALTEKSQTQILISKVSGFVVFKIAEYQF